MAAGPFDQIKLPGGASAPFYLLRYDAHGRTNSPQAAALLRAAAVTATDIFLFSHGWNNVFRQALERYQHFISGYLAMRAELDLPTPQPYRPVLAGLIWPSTSFVPPEDEGPVLAAEPGPPGGVDEVLLREVTADLPPDDAARLCELVDGADALTQEEARLAAGILLRGYAAVGDGPGDSDGAGPPPTVASLLDSWARLDGVGQPALVDAGDPEEFGAADDGVGPSPLRPAGWDVFDPRTILRQATVWTMKARSGAVGVHGVGPLVQDLLAAGTARVHLIGHSFGARVLLSALAAAPLPRPVESLLLLQAAVNRWCFAPHAADDGLPGGYHPVLDRVSRPIMVTFTSHDQPLRQVFHWVMRGDHLGELQIAALGEEDRYGALGGYGPAGLGGMATVLPVAEPGRPYAIPAGVRVVAIDGSPAISGHGAISNPATWWMLHQVTSPP